MHVRWPLAKPLRIMAVLPAIALVSLFPLNASAAPVTSTTPASPSAPASPAVTSPAVTSPAAPSSEPKAATDEPVDAPQVTVDSPTITSMKLASTGIRVTGTGFDHYCSVNFTLNGKQFGYVNCDENGAFTSDYFQTIIPAGTYQLVVDDGNGHHAETSVTVTGPTPATPQVTFTPSTISAADLYFQGTQASGSGFPPNSSIEILGAASGLPIGTTTSDASGNVSYLLKGESIPAQGGILFRAAAFEAIADIVVTPSFSAQLSPSSISSAALASTGTTVSGTFFPEAAQVTISIDGKNSRVAAVDAQRNLNFVFKQAGITPGKHLINLSWPASVAPGYPAGSAGTKHVDLPLTVTVAAVALANNNTSPASSVKPLEAKAVLPAATGPQELAYSGTNPLPAWLGLFFTLAGVGVVFFTRRSTRQH